MFQHAVRGNEVIAGTEQKQWMGRRVTPQQMCIERPLFDAAGFPYVEGGSPSSTPRTGPVVRKRV